MLATIVRENNLEERISVLEAQVDDNNASARAWIARVELQCSIPIFQLQKEAADRGEMILEEMEYISVDTAPYLEIVYLGDSYKVAGSQGRFVKLYNGFFVQIQPVGSKNLIVFDHVFSPGDYVTANQIGFEVGIVISHYQGSIEHWRLDFETGKVTKIK